MATSMQDHLLDQLEARIAAVGLTAVIAREWANTGALHAMDGMASLMQITYNFQRSQCTLTFTGAAVEGCPCDDDPPLYRRDGDTITFYNLDYMDVGRVRFALALAGDMLAAETMV